MEVGSVQLRRMILYIPVSRLVIQPVTMFSPLVQPICSVLYPEPDIIIISTKHPPLSDPIMNVHDIHKTPLSVDIETLCTP